MPRASAWFIRLSLIYLALGITLGALMLANKGLPFGSWLYLVLPAHSEILLIGWLVQLSLGMAYWILPRFTKGSPRGNARMAWLSLVIFNVGILSAALGAVFNIAWFVPLGRLLEAVSVIAFLWVAWRRVRPVG